MNAIKQTYTGRRVNLLDFRPADANIVDIAWALSNLARFDGHAIRTRDGHTYSVGQHSILVAQFCPPEHMLAGLLHDAAEAYTGDISSPMKAVLRTMCGEQFKVFEAVITGAVFERFGVPHPFSPDVKKADLQLLSIERRDLMLPSHDVIDADWGNLPEPIPNTRVVIMPPDQVFNLFLATFDQLVRERRRPKMTLATGGIGGDARAKLH